MMEEQSVMKNISTPRITKSSKEVKGLSPSGSKGSKVRDKYVASKYSAECPKSKTDCTTSGTDEIIKYMSSLPCYLQHPRKDGSETKALNFGVLDWSLLEDWTHIQKNTRGYKSSSKAKLPSTSDPSTSFTDSRCSSAEQRRKSLSTPCAQESLASSGVKHTKTSAENDTGMSSKFQTEPSRRRYKGKQGMDQTLGRMGFDSQKMKMMYWNNEDSSECLSFSVNKGVYAPKIKNYDFLSAPDESEAQDVFSCFKELSTNPSVLNRPSTIKKGDCPVNSSGVCSLTSSVEHTREATDPQGSSLSKMSHPPRTSSVDSHHKIQHSHVFPEGQKASHADESTLDFDRDTIIVPSHRRKKQSKHNHRNTHLLNNSRPSDFHASNELSDRLHDQVGDDEVKESTMDMDPSANDLSSLPSDMASRGHSFRKGRVTGPSCSGFALTKSDSIKLDAASHQADVSSTDQIKSESKRQIGPLWRMLTPLVKSRGRNYVQSSPQQKTETNNVCIPLLPQLSLAEQEGCKTSYTNSSSINDEIIERTSDFHDQHSTNPTESLTAKRPMALAHRAFLQIITKNEIPSFLFFLENHSDSFAAIERRININGKKTLHWMYTFYAVTGIKKKIGWIKHGKNEDKHWRVSSVVGHMEASCFVFPQLTRGGISESSLMLEYVLSGVRPKDSSPGQPDCKNNVDDPMLHLHSCDELAALIINITPETAKLGAREGNHDSEEILSTVKNASDCYSSPFGNFSKKENRTCDSVQVILPSGLHGVPANEAGMPSRLIDRWRSGGTCDCGGWDEGCSLTVLDNQVQQSKNSPDCLRTLADADVPQQVDLFVQGAHVDIPALRFALIHEGLYSVDFVASITSFQAFAVGLAILHSRSEAVTSGVCTKILLESLLATQEGRFHISNRFQGTGSLKSILDPPVSPVGRAWRWFLFFL